MKRRAFIAGLGAAVGWPLMAAAQAPARRPLVAWLSGGGRSGSMTFVDAFLKGMHELGYVEGNNFDIVYRYADGYIERLPSLADEVVRLHPKVILAPASGPAVAAKKATSTIPIVTPALGDAVHLGLIATESRPAGNVTGISPYVAGLPAKQMELAREVVPAAAKIGALTNLDDPRAPPQWQELKVAGQELGLDVVGSDAGSPDTLEVAFQALASQRIDVMIVLQTSMLLTERRRIAALTAVAKIPAVYGYREHVDDGGLVSYGVDLRECFRRGAYYVDKIIKGAAPGDLPVEFPTKLELVVNLKAARALGLAISPQLLARADDVIE